MKRTFFTVSSADDFQYFIPLYVAAIRTWSTDDIRVYLRGKLNKDVEAALKYAGQCVIIQDFGLKYQAQKYTSSALRFTTEEGLGSYDYVMINDLDMLNFIDPWQWFIMQMSYTKPFAGYHGATRKPYRKEVCEKWVGDFERTAGGIFCVSKNWWKQTREQRLIDDDNLKHRIGYREYDEVMLSRIIKRSGMIVPPNKYLPSPCRGLHLGDFKFENRYTKKRKMVKIVAQETLAKFLKFTETEQYKNMMKHLKNEFLLKMINIAIPFAKERLLNGTQ